VLYLDTARLGRMAPGAQEAHRDFVRFAGEDAGSPAFEDFLCSGSPAWPAARRRCYPGLASWGGLAALKQSLRQLAGIPSDLPLILANRSAQLMKFAARLLFHPCEHVLVTDTGWPSYHAALEREGAGRRRAITCVAIRDAVLRGRAGEDHLVGLIVSAYVANRCDGFFLTAVSHDGIRLPVERIVQETRARQEVRLVAVDGAQDFCHVYPDLCHECCDFYLAGCHKWLGAYYPMGLGFYGRRRSRQVVETVLERMLRDGDLDDPLLLFSQHLEGGCSDGVAETVNLASLFACQGAVVDAVSPGREGRTTFALRLANAHAAADAIHGSDWHPLLADPALRSGILLLQSDSPLTRRASPGLLRRAFHARGLAVTAYSDGLIRLSMPPTPWRGSELDLLRQAFQRVA
jgi:hypothetical protein